MNRTSVYLNKNWTGYRIFGGIASPNCANAPILSIVTRISLLGYLISLALTQTVYGWPFMPVRWAMLGLLAASSIADVILVSRHAEFRARSGNGLILTIYLLLTFGTVIYAENWMFSGTRWVSHAIMLVVFMISLPQLITLRQIRQMMVFLKYMMGFLVIISWILPTYDNANQYQGAMGNANSMGDIAFISAFLFLQHYTTEKLPRVRNIAGIMALISVITIWKSGARSAMIAFAAGVILLCYYYRKNMKGTVLVGILAGSVAMVSFPQIPEQIFHFAQKTDRNKKGSTSAMQSRIPVWTEAYQGFKARPLIGWGFGADSTIAKEWTFQFTSLGATERDVVNDFLFMMEGGGIVGLGSYVLLIMLVLKQRPNRSQRAILQTFSRDQVSRSRDMDLHHTHVGLYVLPVCLMVLFQVDNTALSAGNLISLTVWLCTGCAAVLRHEIGTR
jgi:O-antigen ligase